MQNRPRTRLAGPLLALASLTLVALAAEVVLRVQHARSLAELRAERPERELCTEADPELVYRYVPGRCGANSRGFRDAERSPAPAPGSWRLVVLGDSVAVGDGVALEERFDRVLVRRLADAGVSAEAVNLARTGYSTGQELLLLERDVYDYAPDVVLWSYVLNDPAHPVFHNANGRLGRYYARPRVHVWHGLRRLLFKARERLAELRCPSEFHALLHCAYADAVAADLARIGELARDHATPTLFVLHPVFEEQRGFTASSFADLHHALAERARGAGLVVVDLLEAYRGEDPASLQQRPAGWFDPWHPNARGHALAARAIEAALREHGLLPSPP